MSGRKAAIVTAMWVLGAVAFATFAWLVQWMDGSPVHVPEQADVPSAVAAEQPLAALTAGVARAAGTAAYHLERGERSKASHATDAAMRAAEVGHETSHGEVKAAFAAALQRIVLAREDLHEGDPSAAREHLAAATDRLAPVIDAARTMSPGVPPPEVREAYEGAMLINANGSMIGQVQTFLDGDGPVEAQIRIGGANDVLGVMDFGGQSIEVPANRLLWGPRRSIGSIIVSLPVETSSMPEIISETSS